MVGIMTFSIARMSMRACVCIGGNARAIAMTARSLRMQASYLRRLWFVNLAR